MLEFEWRRISKIGDQLREGVMGKACSVHERNSKCIQFFLLKNLKGRSQLGELGVDGKITLK
jgi:hypothetical protein